MDPVAAKEFLKTADYTAHNLYKRYTNLQRQFDVKGE
jgi:hypothetical protein